MADPTTLNVLLAVPAHGSDEDTWDQPLNNNSTAVDGFFGGVQTISVSSSPITLTAPSGSVTPSGGPTQSQNAVLRFTGTLTANVTITLPLPSYYIVENLTTGSFNLIFRAVASGRVIATEQGSTQHIYNDGTDVRFVNLPPVGTYLDICDATVPSWIGACSIPPYLNCTGATFSATTYPYLNQKLGGNTLPNLKGVVRATLNQGTGNITTAGSGIDGNTRFSTGGSQNVTLGIGEIPQHTHNNTLFDPGHTHGIAIGSGTGSSGSYPAAPGAFRTGTGNSDSSTTGVSITNASVGSGNFHQNMPPTTISGITLIRAA